MNSSSIPQHDRMTASHELMMRVDIRVQEAGVDYKSSGHSRSYDIGHSSARPRQTTLQASDPCAPVPALYCLQRSDPSGSLPCDRLYAYHFAGAVDHFQRSGL
jgi:hypothetical protein